ncbi:MAG: secretin N-terminal domain-containing protein [Candidatus Omnitrophota bacterium]|nr:secretin N-terminal domain-containing protein [Candidatus Omnitrophota bacterium]
MRKTLFIIIISFFITAPPASAGSEDLQVEVFKIQHGDAVSIYPAVVHLNSKEGKTTLHSATNSLIVRDYPANLRHIRKVLDRLDNPRKQVEIKLLVVEMTDTLMGEAGLDAGQSVIPPERFDEIFWLLSKSESADIRTQMTVKTLSGEPARTQVALKEVFPRTIITDKGNIGVNWVDRKPVGNILEVLPRVNNDGSITMILRPAIGEIRKDHSIYERSVITQVVINSGDTIAIGGMDRVERRLEQAGVTPLGVSVPLRGAEKYRTVIMFVTATVSE